MIGHGTLNNYHKRYLLLCCPIGLLHVTAINLTSRNTDWNDWNVKWFKEGKQGMVEAAGPEIQSVSQVSLETA